MHRQKPLLQQTHILILFWLCWAAYFTAYFGRLNYSAVMAEVISAEGFTNARAGLIGTGFFITYGVGQIFGGYLGDKFSPKYLVFFGLSLSALCNLGMGLSRGSEVMLVLWCMNGLAQSFTWSPILRIFSEYFPGEYQKKACVHISTTYVAAILLIYPLSSLVIAKLSWRPVFFGSAAFLLFVALLWLGGLTAVSRFPRREAEQPGRAEREGKSVGLGGRAVVAVLGILGLALVMQGILRDGLITWAPSYLKDVFSVDASFSVLCTTLLPVINLFGVYAADLIRTKAHQNEISTCAILFGISTGLLLLLFTLGKYNMLVTLLCFGGATSCMLGVNTMLVSLIPTYFASRGRVGFTSGILNACVYLGSSISAYGIGFLADGWGWNVLLFTLAAVSGLGILFCILAIPGTKRHILSISQAQFNSQKG